MFDVIVSGGRIIHEDGALIGDVAISGETIAEVAPQVAAAARRRIDATGLAVLPGLIDPHVHLGLPMKGTRASDDVASGTRAALHGGVTTVIDFTLQRPGESLPDCLDERRREFAGSAFCDHAFHANLTDFTSRPAERLPIELSALLRRGCTSLKIFTTYSREGMRIPPSLLRPVLRLAAENGCLVLVHAEDDGAVEAATARLARSGKTAPGFFPESRPAEAEKTAVEEVIGAATGAGAPVYFVHVSTAAALDAVVRGRGAAASPIYAETCPQYLFLSDELYQGADAAQFIVTPPLRSPSDREALRQGLTSGAIDVVATDHCAFRREQKDRPGSAFGELPSGLPGLETRLALLHTLGRTACALDLSRIVRLLATRPARIFGLHPQKGAIQPGADADLVLFDPERRWTIRAGSLHMNTDFSPYAGMEVQGRVRSVLLRGRVVIEEGRAASEEPTGQYLHRSSCTCEPAD